MSAVRYIRRSHGFIASRVIWCLAMILLLAKARAQEAPAPEPARQPVYPTNLPTTKPEGQSSCITCHSQLGGQLSVPTKPFPTDVHSQNGLTCASCHGGDPESMDPKISMSPAKGFRGKPRRRDVPQFCGRCHSDAEYMHRFSPTVKTDQVSQYFTSKHGKLLQQGVEQVATCINCHSVHDIKLVSDPSSPVYPTNVPETCGSCHSNAEYMKEFKELSGFTQVADYKKSVHYESLSKAGNLSAPTCVTCHSGHGATPTGVKSVADVCGTCHKQNLQLFQASKHAAVFQDLEAPACITCHSNHSVQRASEVILTGQQSVCMSCHSDGDAGAELAKNMAGQISKLDMAIGQAKEIVESADHAGMDVQEATADLTTARSSLIMARTTVHSMDAAKVGAEVEKGLPVAERAAQAGRDRLAEIQWRRKSVALFSLLVLFIVAALYFYIRAEDRSTQTS